MNMFQFLRRFLMFFLAFFCLLLGFLSSDYLLESGKGRIIEKIEEPAPKGKTKLYLIIDGGQRVHCSYSFGQKAQIGDEFFKKKWSFTFYLNGQPHSEFWEFLPFLLIAAPLLALFFALKR